MSGDRHIAGDWSLDELINLGIDEAKKYLHVAIPAKVTKIYEGQQAVDAQPLVRRWLYKLDDPAGGITYEDLPICPFNPIVFPRSQGTGAYMTLPIAVGDIGLLLFSEVDYTAAYETGELSDPRFTFDHHLSSGIFLPGGFFKRGAQIENGAYDHENITLGFEGGGAKVKVLADGSVEIHAGEVRLGSAAAAEALAKASAVEVELTAIKATLQSLAGATFGVPYEGPGNVGSSTAKVDD